MREVRCQWTQLESSGVRSQMLDLMCLVLLIEFLLLSWCETKVFAALSNAELIFLFYVKKLKADK